MGYLSASGLPVCHCRKGCSQGILSISMCSPFLGCVLSPHTPLTTIIHATEQLLFLQHNYYPPRASGSTPAQTTNMPGYSLTPSLNSHREQPFRRPYQHSHHLPSLGGALMASKIPSNALFPSTKRVRMYMYIPGVKPQPGARRCRSSPCPCDQRSALHCRNYIELLLLNEKNPSLHHDSINQMTHTPRL
jgi:hypothetical protein